MVKTCAKLVKNACEVVDAHNGGHLKEGWGGVGVLELRSCNIATKAVAGISVLTIKRLSQSNDLTNILVSV